MNRFCLFAKTDAGQVFAYTFTDKQFRLVEARVEADLAQPSHPLDVATAIELIRGLRTIERRLNECPHQDLPPPEH